MCQALAEAFSGVTPTASDEETWPATEDLQAADQGLAEARRVSRRAAASIGRLERLASQVRGEIPPAVPTLLDLSALSPQDLERLTQVRDACAQVAPMLRETAQAITATCQNGVPGGEGLTIHAYRAAFEGAQAAAREAETTLSSVLGRLRADLAAGALSPTAWTLQDWLTRTLQSLTAFEN